ncbi:unnamed protein product [Sphagnum jensenii]
MEFGACGEPTICAHPLPLIFLYYLTGEAIPSLVQYYGRREISLLDFEGSSQS